MNSVLEGADAALGRALGEMGLATLKADGHTIDQLTLGNTLVVIVGDNGSFGPTVRVADGFDATRSKGTVYQTGVWVPLIVAGAKVSAPGRSVDALVNITDLYRLFAEVAGVDVRKAVPPSHRIDGRPMLSYLLHEDAEPVRTTNFTELDPGTFSADPDERSWPCVVGGPVRIRSSPARPSATTTAAPGTGRARPSSTAPAAPCRSTTRTSASR